MFIVVSYDPLYFCGVDCNFLFHFWFYPFGPSFSWWVWLKIYLFYLLFQRTNSYLHCYFIYFKIYFIYFFSDFCDFSLVLTLGFVSSPFSSSFRCAVRLLMWDFSYFLRKAWITTNLPLKTAFSASHRFWIIVFSFSFVAVCLFIFFLQWLIHCSVAFCLASTCLCFFEAFFLVVDF